ncbi:alanyl-tRNA editing protein [Deinococcus sonorensis]|uniref:Alanine--tRNA ligase-related protein n=2 Tax=Deinococcus sonorensis TaxID=309891 RepID=A0AAU7U9J9_9DEIO
MTPTATQRLYWSRPLDQRFTARVLAVDGPRVAMDRTLFYPEGGGQNADAGQLQWTGGTAQVTDVQKSGEVIWHTLAGDLPAPEAEVEGQLDWTRRYRHTQRHSAEHLLAQAFHRLNPAFGVRAVSMRGAECTLDLAGQPSEAHARQAEQLLMERLRDGLTLDTVMVEGSDLQRFPLRRPPQVEGPVRVVLFRAADGEIWEASACGGTHLPRAEQAAPVFITRLDHIKGGLTRVTFMAGEEATERLTRVYRQSQQLSRDFSSSLEDLPVRVAEQRSTLLDLRSDLERTQRQLARHLLQEAVGQPWPGTSATFRLLELPTATLLKAATEEARTLTDSLTLLWTTEGRCALVSDVAEAPAQVLLARLLSSCGGRGGGKPELAQGAMPDPAAFVETVRNWYAQAHES